MNAFERYSNIVLPCCVNIVQSEDIEDTLSDDSVNTLLLPTRGGKSGWVTDQTEIDGSSDSENSETNDVYTETQYLGVNKSTDIVGNACSPDIVCNEENLRRFAIRVRKLKESNQRMENFSKKNDKNQNVLIPHRTISKLGLCDNLYAECIGMSKECPRLQVRSSYSYPTFQEQVSFGVKPLITRKDVETSNEIVVVAVEATNICPIDLFAPQINDALSSVDGLRKSPLVLGSNFVGEVHKSDLMEEGTRVAGLCEIGSNSRFISIKLESLVNVPKTLSASEAACVLTDYLPAFQALHHGISRRYKYKRKSLRGKIVLLTAGASISQITAMSQLAKAADAKRIYVFSEPKYHKYIRKVLGIKPLDSTALDPLTTVPEEIDIIMDYDYSKHHIDISIVLSDEGRLVWITYPSTEERNPLWQVQKFLHEASMCALKQASIYDIRKNWQTSSEETKNDLRYLFNLLSSRRIDPIIERKVRLKDVEAAHQEILQNPNIRGALVCEPWSNMWL